MVERELGFLQYLDTNQPPLIETLYLLANAAPAGTRLDSVSLARRGDLSLRGTAANPQLTAELRAKLAGPVVRDRALRDEGRVMIDREEKV